MRALTLLLLLIAVACNTPSASTPTAFTPLIRYPLSATAIGPPACNLGGTCDYFIRLKATAPPDLLVAFAATTNMPYPIIYEPDAGDSLQWHAFFLSGWEHVRPILRACA